MPDVTPMELKVETADALTRNVQPLLHEIGMPWQGYLMKAGTR